MLKQSLENKMTADNKNMEKQKTAKAEDEKAKAVEDGDLATSEKALAEAQAALAACNNNCMQVATGHADTVKGRG